MAHSRRTGSAGRRAAIAVLAWVACGTCLAASGGVFLRVQLKEPGGATYHVRLGGYIHNDPWYLPPAVIPEGADRDPARRLPSGRFTPWFDVAKHAGKLLHGRLQRSGGVAEFPNVTLTFAVDPPSKRLAIRIELATSPDEGSVVRRFDESFEGTLTSVLVSPDLAHDAESLETATMMGERRVSWAQRASGGERHSPRQLILQTSLWAPQGPEPNRLEAEVLYLLGFNVVGNQTPEARALGVFREPGQTHDVDIGPSATKDAIEATWKGRGARPRREYAGTPFNFADEVCARPPIGRDPAALANFRAWIVARAIPASELGVARIEDLLPIETPAELEERKKADGERAARRVFYFTSRFRQEAAGERLKWNSDAFHRHIDEDAVTSTLVADHPYFSGTGLGMGIEQNWTWGGHPLALDWFGVARTRAVDCIGIEDWMGLQFMYGPDSTWEGFQLMGFQAAIFRSGSRGALPIIAWITPSDERNLRLKSASALCQGATHFFYWTYGPTATSTENYWSDLRSAYDGIVAIARGLAAAEHILAPGQTRRTRLALLYSISSDLWQPFGYVHMLERRGTYLSLVHGQYLVDLLAEEDIEAGRLDEYDVLYATDPCIGRKASEAIARWVKAGGAIYGSCAAGSLNEFGEPWPGLAEVFGIEPAVTVRAQPGRYSVRAGVNGIPYTDRIEFDAPAILGARGQVGAIGARVSFTPKAATVIGRFSGREPGATAHTYGAGRAIYVGACPGIAYIKEAKFVPAELAEKWPEELRRIINGPARSRAIPPLVELSRPVVEAGVYDAPAGTALVLANFTYEPIEDLRVTLEVPRAVGSVRSVERGTIGFSLRENGKDGRFPFAASFSLPLGLNDIVLLEPRESP